jgi:hypothetical protein
MSEHKTSEQVSDEDFKIEPTSADKERLDKQRATEKREDATGENYQLPAETKAKEELREGVE